MGGWLKDKIINFVKDKIPGPIRSALGIKSPSKVAALLGKQVPAGLAQGIDANAAMVAKAASNMADKAIVGMTSPLYDPSVAFSGGAGIGSAGGPGVSNSNTTQSVNIQKIVLGDESAVKEFFKQLNSDTIKLGMGLTPNQGAV